MPPEYYFCAICDIGVSRHEWDDHYRSHVLIDRHIAAKQATSNPSKPYHLASSIRRSLEYPDLYVLSVHTKKNGNIRLFYSPNRDSLVELASHICEKE